MTSPIVASVAGNESRPLDIVAVENPLRSERALQRFQIDSASVVHLSLPLKVESIIAAQETKAGEAKSHFSVNDGVLRFRWCADSDPKTPTISTVLDVPGLGTVGDVRVDKHSGEIVKFDIRADRALLSKILLASPSPIAHELLRQIPDSIAPLTTWPEVVAKAVEVFEDEAVVVVEGGDTVVIRANRHDPREGVQIIALRSGIDVIQTMGLGTCHALLVSGFGFGLLAHATNPEMLRVLNDGAARFLSASKMELAVDRTWLVRHNSSSFEFGDLSEEAAFEGEARRFVSLQFGAGTPVSMFNGGSCCMHIPLRQMRRETIRLIPPLDR